MPARTAKTWRTAARCAAMAALVMAVTGCRASPASAPSPPPAPTPSPSPIPVSVNAVFMAPPAVPPRSDTSALVGRYLLEIDAGARSGQSCAFVPAPATRREYTADIEDLGGRYAVKLFDATFLADSSGVSYGCRDPRLPQSGHAACHQFLLTGDADALTVTAQSQDEWRGSEIWEGLPDGSLLEITGRADGAVRNGRIEASGTGRLWYGNGLPASTVYACESAAMKFTFSPR